MLELRTDQCDDRERLSGSRRFTTYVTDILVVTNRDELRMPQLVAVGPFRVFDLRGKPGLERESRQRSNRSFPIRHVAAHH
jgi:hypothetical protein